MSQTILTFIILLVSAISLPAAEKQNPHQYPMSCATIMYSLPGEQFMHKLVPNEGDNIIGVDFIGLCSLTLNADRVSTGNRYFYISGKAPQEEGEYTYIIHLSKTDGTEEKVPVSLIVSSHLQSPTPAMSWLTWNWFAQSISHEKMVAVAEGMEKYGLIDAGYNTLLLDDCWGIPQEDKAKLTYDPVKFPEGISGLRTALKKVNPKMKLGIYSDAGSMTCETYQPGSYLFEEQHLAMFDSWGVDVLKYDYCNSEADTEISYTRMGDAIKKLNEKRKAEGRIPFVFNICEWGSTSPWLWGAKAGGSSWRATGDEREDWVGNHGRPGVIGGVDEVRNLWMYAGVNHFNDLDMMCIGLHGLGGPSNNTATHKSNNGKVPELTDAQARTQMSLWCMLSSPLSLTCDLRVNPQGEANTDFPLPEPLITKSDIETLTNKEIIAINQDALGQQAEYMSYLSTGKELYMAQGYDVYLKDLANGRFAVAVTNRSTSPVVVPDLQLSDLYMLQGKKYRCHDIWSKTDSVIENTLSVGALQPCETRVYVIAPDEG